jgi:glycerophosphoryl diester phosphodiesterase
VDVAPSFWVIGHRGSPVHQVENTLTSFASALDEGANAVEVDVSVTRDGRGVLWHDWDPNSYKALARTMCLEPCVGHRPVGPFDHRRKRTSALSLTEFRERFGYAEKRWRSPRLDVRVPTLRDLFEWGAHQSRLLGLFLDIKIPRSEIHFVPVLLSEIDALVTRTKPAFRVVLETAESSVLAELRRLGSCHAACFDVEPRPGFAFDLAAGSAARPAIEHGARMACAQRPRASTALPFFTHCRIVARDLALQRTHNAGSPRVPLEAVVTCTINDEREMSSLIQLGVAGIQTDRPGLLRRVAERLGRVARWLAPPGMPKSEWA